MRIIKKFIGRIRQAYYRLERNIWRRNPPKIAEVNYNIQFTPALPESEYTEYEQ